MTRAVKCCLMRAGKHWTLNWSLSFLKFQRYCRPRDLFQNRSLLNGVCYSPENSLAQRIIYIHNYLPGREGQERASVIAAALELGPRMQVCLRYPLAPSHLIPKNNGTRDRVIWSLLHHALSLLPMILAVYIYPGREEAKQKNRRKDGGVDEKRTIPKTVKPGRLWFYGIMVEGCTMKSWLLLIAILSAISHPAGKGFFVNTHHDFNSMCVGVEELGFFFKLHNQGERRQAQYMREKHAVSKYSYLLSPRSHQQICPTSHLLTGLKVEKCTLLWALGFFDLFIVKNELKVVTKYHWVYLLISGVKNDCSHFVSKKMSTCRPFPMERNLKSVCLVHNEDECAKNQNPVRQSN